MSKAKIEAVAARNKSELSWRPILVGGADLPGTAGLAADLQPPVAPAFVGDPLAPRLLVQPVHHFPAPPRRLPVDMPLIVPSHPFPETLELATLARPPPVVGAAAPPPYRLARG